MSDSVHIVIVNWNTGDYLRECLASIVRSESDTVARVTVVDNASSDDSANGLDDLPLPLEVIRNNTNLGFAAACNQGAAGSAAEYLLFLNPDTQLLPGTLGAVTAFMESEQAAAIGICGVQVVDSDGNSRFSCARFPSLRVLFGRVTGLHLLLPRLFPSYHLAADVLQQSQVVDQVIGAFYFVRRELFTRLGGFDERYFLYFEEVDFALRARGEGARSYFLREASVLHIGNVSSNQVRDVRLYHSLRSRLLFGQRHWPRWRANLLLILTLTVEPTARLASAALHRRASDVSATVVAYRRLVSDLSSSGRG